MNFGLGGSKLRVILLSRAPYICKVSPDGSDQSPEGKFLSMQFERSKDAASDLQVIGENSSDLSNWTPLITAVRVISDSGLTETLEATDDQPYDTNAIRFLRIRVIAQ